MELGLDGKIALVTGSSKGLGRACAASLSREGARVAICARHAEPLREAEASLEGETLALVADVTDPEEPQRLVQSTVDRFGGLNVLVANAGGPPAARALDVDDASLEAALNANLLGSIRLVRAAVPHMRETGWGRIVLITSRTVKQPNPSLALSNTARTGLWAWAKTAAQDLFADGITLNLVAPGTHATDRAVELGLTGPMGEPADFGDAVAFLCSEQARFITASAVSIDGGETLGLL
ncbi:MAG: SDR family oxidoreductase [Actinomycetota bacterium]